MEVDPLGFGGGDPNLYRYVTNAPTNATDPSGLTLQAATTALDQATHQSAVADYEPVSSSFQWHGNSFPATDVPKGSIYPVLTNPLLHP